MYIDLKFTKIIVTLTLLTNAQVLFNPTNRISRHVNYIKQDSKVFQVVMNLHESIEIESIANHKMLSKYFFSMTS